MNLKFFSFLLLVGAVLVGSSFTQIDPSWKVPDEYKNMENPVAGDEEMTEIGEELWEIHCRSCHGKEGLGDGPKAAQLETPSGDFTSEAFHDQTDGEMYYKTVEGRGDMPGYKKKIPNEEDMWALVNFMRTLE